MSLIGLLRGQFESPQGFSESFHYSPSPFFLPTPPLSTSVTQAIIIYNIYIIFAA